jgi:hypothetical protein
LDEIPQEDLENEKRAKASAWYVVTYANEYRNKEKGEKAKELIGFPWVMVAVLGRIKRKE